MYRLRALEGTLKDVHEGCLQFKEVRNTMIAGLPPIDDKWAELENLMGLAEYTVAAARHQTSLPGELQQELLQHKGVQNLSEKLKAVYHAAKALAKELKTAYKEAQEGNPAAHGTTGAVARACPPVDACTPHRARASSDSNTDIVKHMDSGGLVDQVAGVVLTSKHYMCPRSALHVLGVYCTSCISVSSVPVCKLRTM